MTQDSSQVQGPRFKPRIQDQVEVVNQERGHGGEQVVCIIESLPVSTLVKFKKSSQSRAHFGSCFSIRTKVGFGAIERKCRSALCEMGSTCLRWVPHVFMYVCRIEVTLKGHFVTVLIGEEKRKEWL